MKQIVIIKQIDFWLQIAAIVGPLIAAIVCMELEVLFFMLFTLGAIQYLSCIINRLLLDNRLRNSTRIAYEAILFAITILALIGFSVNEDIIFPLLDKILVAGPFGALWYLTITAMEKNRILQARKRIAKNYAVINNAN